jgi:preprotein translocase subunit SecA
MYSLRSLFTRAPKPANIIAAINEKCAALRTCTDDQLRAALSGATLEETIAITAVAAARVLGQEMFDVQLQGTLALAHGKIAEMQTGEGKTLAAVPAAVWYARRGAGVHVMTVNDYLARRDAAWMGEIYRFLGLNAAAVQQGMSIAQRQAAYRADIIYATPNEIGFDYLRDQMALYPAHQVHRPFAAAIIDEADSILIDEARIPLVIAGGADAPDAFPVMADSVARHMFSGAHFTVEAVGRNISLTDAGIHHAERMFGRGNLYEEANLDLLTALQDALHAHFLLRRDVDYIVKDGIVQSVDEFKGRIAHDRRWPAGLHTALEIKERVATRPNGVVLGSITLQNLIALYPEVCGMTGTAATQARELFQVYGLEVEVIPTNRPMIRIDRPDVLFPTKADKERAVIQEITRVHASEQPVLIGTSSVEESERLSRKLTHIPHSVLNARNDEQEAAIIARAGQRGAVTISTNMAGRGTDIKLGEGATATGGLYVIGTNRHESRRIDHQLRGRAGRQGDPGESRFLVSLEDDIVMKYGGSNPAEVQKMAEGQNLEIRLFLQKYESTTEGQRLRIQARRQGILTSDLPELERLVSLRAIDDLWSAHLAAIAELRSGVHWVSWGGRDPLHEFLTCAHQWFDALEAGIPVETSRRLAEAEATGLDPAQRGAVWTYLTTDQPFGTWTQRVMKGLIRKYKSS